MSVRIINADVMAGLAQLPDESVHCVVTSPPYWGLRQYIADGAPEKPFEIGLEPAPDAFVARMVEVFREVRRVLRKDGTCWVNLGDSYCSAPKGNPGVRGNINGGKRDTAEADAGAAVFNKSQIPGIKQKDLVGIPWRVAFALQADGWWLRQDIIWHKPNPMPESVTDRCTKSHEYVFLLTKSASYFYDAEAIKELGVMQPRAKEGGAGESAVDRKLRGFDNCMGSDGSRNKRSVWSIATAPFSEAHFATFPPELPELCIKAGCPKGGTVLDPFSGAGTTALVADRLQRHAIGIELNPEYAAMSERRINKDRGGLLDMMEAAE